ncbi:hypothetical protein JYY74_004253 [Salmonella enterica subsp. enterica serovar Enteritidis]|nr:hypothetical protein [Salmonella enterica subsp. enterica serovar Enteritidis]
MTSSAILAFKACRIAGGGSLKKLTGIPDRFAGRLPESWRGRFAMALLVMKSPSLKAVRDNLLPVVRS